MLMSIAVSLCEKLNVLIELIMYLFKGKMISVSLAFMRRDYNTRTNTHTHVRAHTRYRHILHSNIVIRSFA